MAIHLKNLGCDTVIIGISFAIPTFFYAATSPLVFLITSRLNKRGSIIGGLTALCISCIFIGPSKIIGIHESTFIIVFGLCILGFGAGLTIVPILPELIECIEENHPNFDKDKLNNLISGLFIVA